MNQNNEPNRKRGVFEDSDEFGTAPRDLYAERLHLGLTAIAFTSIFLAATLIRALLLTLVAHFVPAWQDAAWYGWASATVPSDLAMLLSLLLFRQTSANPPQKRGISPLVFFGVFCVCLFLTFAGSELGQLVEQLAALLTGNSAGNPLDSLMLSSPLWVNLLFCGILAPVAEEIFYRKLVLDRLRRYGDLFAVLTTGILFGLIHGNLMQFPYAAAAGILFSYVYLRTGHILVTILLHMGINLMTGVWTAEILKRLPPETAGSLAGLLRSGDTGAVIYLSLCALAIPAALICIVCFLRRLRFARVKNALTPSDWRFCALLNPALWILALVIVLLYL